MQTEKLSISLPMDMARMVRRQVEEGGYASNSEVIRDALRLWQQRQQDRDNRLEAIRASLNEAAADPVRYSAEDISEYFSSSPQRGEGGA
ncbi:type II toxin-antitoxin system ParD family antitoxin [Pararhizobium sp.]|uniref:type II toxin-antitoxin system ParD family antitoxin n=1 Tax=Pararhizobium sp. TaxID=1977563 RepID=UPI0027167EFE|nr:type II toxin-antitoxin system ParD family antitoxin [Pararhizobium sp.]MDO9417316.1 type II toxin-antitoxin system ParD family antitoxin [Pararhizobium sp.]